MDDRFCGDFVCPVPRGILAGRQVSEGIARLPAIILFKSLFTSDRERRLWAWTLAIVVAIYSTLGLARVLAVELRSRDLLAAAFLLGMGLVGAVVVILALKARPGGIEIGVGLGIAVAYYMVFIRMTILEERSHIFEYSVVAVFIYEALTERKMNGGRVRSPALLAIAGTALVGAIDEFIQLFLPSRVFDPQDILFNFLAGLMAVGASAAMGWARRRRIAE